LKLLLPAVSLIFLAVSASVQAQTTGQIWCAVQYIDTANSNMVSLAVGLGQISDSSDEVCQDAALHLQIFMSDPGSKKLISAAATLIPTGTDPITFYESNTWSRSLTQTDKDTYWCLLSSGGIGGVDLTASGNWLINLMPSSPDEVKIPTQINKLAGDGSLASNLLIELYSAGWQSLALFSFIKFFRMLPFIR